MIRSRRLGSQTQTIHLHHHLSPRIPPYQSKANRTWKSMCFLCEKVWAEDCLRYSRVKRHRIVSSVTTQEQIEILRSFSHRHGLQAFRVFSYSSLQRCSLWGNAPRRLATLKPVYLCPQSSDWSGNFGFFFPCIKRVLSPEI